MDIQSSSPSTENTSSTAKRPGLLPSTGSVASDAPGGVVQLEIGIGTLKSLFATGKLCVADLRCLNDASKAAIWSLCLSSCANRSHCDFSGLESCSACAQTSASWYRIGLAS